MAMAVELPLTRADISPGLTAACWRLFYNTLLFLIVLSVILLAVVGLVYMVMLIPLVNILLGVALVLSYFIIIPIIGYVVTVSYFLVIRDELIITSALSKTISYMRGHFWNTWLLMFCAVISLGMIYMLFNVPYIVLGIMQGFTRVSGAEGSSVSSLVHVLFGGLSMFGSMVVIAPVFATFCIFNFYSQEERREGTSLLSRLEAFDMPQA